MFKDVMTNLYGRFNKKILWNILSNSCKELSISCPYIILSFDCDTEEDIAVVLDVNSRLLDIGIKSVYAVPGELLRRGEKAYGKIYSSGMEFINHGGREHTYFDVTNNRYASCFFYDQQTKIDLENDILLGHKVLQDVLGVIAQGWRTPHFGTFQNNDHFNFLYNILNQLKYKFSSSTCPQMAYKFGATFRNKGILEIPVTGIFTEPFNIMDTWAYFSAPDRVKNADNYVKSCEQLANFAANKPLLINIYGDPSHIYDKPEFFAGMKKLIAVAKNVNYTEYLGIIDGNVRNI